MARPSFQFYPGDYLRDMRLRQCSAESRGVWMDMLCLMHQGLPYGHLRDESGDIAIKSLARLVGLSPSQLGKCLSELESHGVFSRDEKGGIFSRRMARDEEIRLARANGGSASLKNPSVPRKKDILPTILRGKSCPILPPEEEDRRTEESLKPLERQTTGALSESIDLLNFRLSIYRQWKKPSNKYLCFKLIEDKISSGVEPQKLTAGIGNWATYFGAIGWQYCGVKLEAVLDSDTWEYDPPPIEKESKTRVEDLIG